MDSPISSARAERILTSLRLRESPTAAVNARWRPSQLMNVPYFSVTAATGRTTSAISVTEEWAISSDTTNAFFMASVARTASGRSAISTPPTTRASRSPL